MLSNFKKYELKNKNKNIRYKTYNHFHITDKFIINKNEYDYLYISIERITIIH